MQSEWNWLAPPRSTEPESTFYNALSAYVSVLKLAHGPLPFYAFAFKPQV